MVPWKALNGRHVTTSQCARGGKGEIQRLVEEEVWESVERAFQAYGRTLDMVTFFKYLGRVLTESDGYCPELLGNLWKAQNIWARMERILGR